MATTNIHPKIRVGLRADLPSPSHLPVGFCYVCEDTREVFWVSEDQTWIGAPGFDPTSVVFLAPTGNDTNHGTTALSPKRTAKAGFASGAALIVAAPGTYLDQPDCIPNIESNTVRFVCGRIVNGKLVDSFEPVAGAPAGGTTTAPIAPGQVLLDGVAGLTTNQLRGKFVLFNDPSTFPVSVLRQIVSNTATTITMQSGFPGATGAPTPYSIVQPAAHFIMQPAATPGVGSQMRFDGNGGPPNFWNTSSDFTGDSGPGAVVQMYGIEVNCPNPPVGRCLSARNGVALYMIGCQITENNCLVAALQNSQLNFVLAINPRPSTLFPGLPLSILDDLGISAAQFAGGTSWSAGNILTGNSNMVADDDSLIQGFLVASSAGRIVARNDSMILFANLDTLNVGGILIDRQSHLIMETEPGCATSMARNVAPIVDPLVPIIPTLSATDGSVMQVDVPTLTNTGAAAPNPYPGYAVNNSVLSEVPFFGTSQLSETGASTGLDIQGESLVTISLNTTSADFPGATVAEINMGFTTVSNQTPTFNAVQIANQINTLDGNTIQVDPAL